MRQSLQVALAACKRNSGARGLRSILELLLQDALFEVGFSTFITLRASKQQSRHGLPMILPSTLLRLQVWTNANSFRVCSSYRILQQDGPSIICFA